MFNSPKILLLAAMSLTGCVASPSVKIDHSSGTATDKTILLNMVNDPDLIVLDLQEKLTASGLNVDSTAGEPRKSQFVVGNGVITKNDNVSDSNAHYELMVSYSRGGYPYNIHWRSILRDRDNNKVISTYKYDFNAATQSFGWDNDKLISDMIDKELKPFFSLR